MLFQIASGLTFEESIDLKIEYFPERIMYENNAYCDISIGRAGMGKINLATGGLNFVHEDSMISGIKHVYNTWQADKMQTLIEDAVDTDGNAITAEFEHS